MFLDGENAEEGEIPALEAPGTKEPTSLASASEPADGPESQESPTAAASPTSSSFSLDQQDGGEIGHGDDPEGRTSPSASSPRSLGRGLRFRSASVVSTASTVPSLCSSSRSSGSTEAHLPYRSPTRTQSPLPPSPTSQLNVHDHARPPPPSGHPEPFPHYRHTQILMEDLIASLEYDYSDALTHLSPPSSGLSPSSLYPSGDFEPGSSAGTIKNVVSPHARDSIASQHTYILRHGSDSSDGSRWSTEASDIHCQSPVEDLELDSRDVSASGSAPRSPTLSRTPSSSTASSVYDFGEEDGYYSYDLGAFRDPLGSPTSAQQRPVFGYGIPWPSTHRRASGESGGSGGSSSVNDVLSDLEDLAEDLTERFALSMQSPPSSMRSSSRSDDGDIFSVKEGLVDSPEGDYSARRTGRPSGGSSHGQQLPMGGATNGRNGSSSSWTGRSGFYGRGRGEDDGDSDDDRKRRPSRLPVNSGVAIVDSDSEEDTDSEDSGTDDYGHESPTVPTFSRERRDTTRARVPPIPGPVAPAPPARADTAEDDVPLARQIPGALKAQRTIRRQVRDELDQKRAERRAKAEQRALSSAVEPTFPQPPPPQPQPQQNSPSKLVGRPRTRTLPSNVNSPFSAGDLTQKLLGLQTGPGAVASPTSPGVPPLPPSPWTASHSKRTSCDAPDSQALPTSRGRSMTGDAQSHSASLSRQPSRAPAPDRSLRPMRSFHRPSPRDVEIAPPPVPLPVPDRAPQPAPSASAGLQRSGTSSRRRPAAEEPPTYLAPALDRARSVKSDSRRPSIERTPPLPSAAMPAEVLRVRPNTSASQGPPAPAAVSAPSFSQPAKTAGQGQMWQQRVFIGNMQRFVTVELGTGVSAGDVLNMADSQGGLEHGAGSSGWMLWEVSQDFGMGESQQTLGVVADFLHVFFSQSALSATSRC